MSGGRTRWPPEGACVWCRREGIGLGLQIVSLSIKTTPSDSLFRFLTRIIPQC